MKTLLPILKTKLFVLSFVFACTAILATTIPQVRNFIAPQKAIGEKITTEQKKIAPKINKQNKTVNVSRVTSGLSFEMNNSFDATMVSDQPDYAPLSTATFTGDGFAPNEDVVLKVKNLNQPCNTVAADSSYLPWTVIADNDGHFVTTWTVCNCPNDSLRLKATGQTSGLIAYAYFLDAPRFAVASGNWSDPIWATTAGGVAGSAATPTSVDAVTINSGVTVTIAAASNALSLVVNGILNVNSGSNNLTIADGGSITVNGSVIFNSTSVINGGGNGSSGITLTINSGANLTTANISGFVVGSGNGVVGGSFNINPGNKTDVFNSGINYTYNGTANQATGTGLSQNTAANITLSKTGGNANNTVSLSGNVNMSGTLTVNDGSILALGSNTLGATTAPTSLVIATGVTTNTSITGTVVTGVLTLNGNITAIDAGTGTNQAVLNCPIALGAAPRTFTVPNSAATSDLFSGGVISGTGGITKVGPGTLTLGGNNSTYTGATTINDGTVIVAALADGGSNSGIGASTNAAANLVLGGGTLMYTGGTISINRAFTLTAGTGSIIDVNSGAAILTISGASAATTGALIKSGIGTLILSGANSYSGGTTVRVGALIWNNNSALGTGAVTMNDANTGTNNTSLFRNANGTLLVNITVANQGSGTTTIGNDNGAAGTSVVYSGTLTLNKSVTLKGGAGGNASFNGVISGSGGITTAGTGTVTLGNTGNSFAGGVNVNTGTLKLGTSNVIPDGVGKGNINVTGTFDMNTFNETINGLSGAGTVDNVAGAGTPVLTAGANDQTSTFSGIIKNTTGTLALTKTGTGTLTLTGANTYDGTTTISGGVLQLGNGGTTGSLATTGSIANNASLVFNRSNAIAQGTNFSTGAISGSGSLTQNGGGALTLNAANSYSGGTTLNTGTLNINNAQALGTTAGTFTINGGTIDNTSGVAITLTNNNPQNWNADFSFTGSNALDIGTGAVTLSANRQVTVNANSLYVGGVINDDTKSLTKLGNGHLSFGSNNVTLDALTVSAGVLTSTSGTLKVKGNFSIASGGYNHNNGILEFNGAAQNISGNIFLYDVILSGSGNKSVDASAFYNITNSLALNGGSLLLGNNSTLDFSGSSITRTSGSINATNGGLSFSGATNITIPPSALTGSVIFVSVGGGATISLSDDLSVGSFGLGSGIFDIGTHKLFTQDGNLGFQFQAGVIKADLGTVEFNASFQQNMGTFYNPFYNGTIKNLVINNANGITFDNNIVDIAVTNNLNLSSGIVYTGNNTVTIGATGSITGGSGTSHVDGKLRRLFDPTNDIGATKNFTIGKSGNYHPVSLKYTALTGISTVTAEQIESSFATIPATVPPGRTLYAARYWNVSQTGGSGLAYDITLEGTGFAPGTSDVYILKHNGSTTEALATAVGNNYTGSFNNFSSFALAAGCDAPIIATAGDQPQNQLNKCVGGSATFSVNATGTGSASYTYQWYKIGSPDVALTNGGNISGATTNTLTINPLVAGDAGSYYVIVSRPCGSSTTSTSATLTIDVTPPTITAGGTTLTLGCNPSASDINNALGTATATDAVSTPTVSSSDGTLQSSSCGRSQTRTFTARDFCGNTSTASRTVTWIADVTPPVLTTGGTTTTLGCNPSASDINAALGTATATDACSNPVVSASDNAVSSNNCSRSQTRTFTAEDGCGNTSTASRTVSWTYDITPPTLTTGGTTLTLGCNPSASDINAALGTATATDACSNPVVSASDNAVSSNNCSRSQTRTFTAEDGCGNTTTASRTVSWTYDVTPPTLTTGGTTLTLGCNPSASDINAALGTATATDACSNPVVSASDNAVSSNNCSRSQTRTFTAEDGCGNTTTASRTVSWTYDVTPPTLTTGGTTTTLGCNPSASDINAALGTATATDACSNPAVSASDNAVSSNNCSRSQTRTFTAEDGCGNTSTASRTVSWTYDITPPTLTTGGTSLTLGCNPSASDINAALGTATATDACSNPAVSASDNAVSSNNCSRSQTRTFTAEDGCGNTSTASRTVSWTYDITPPTLTTGGTTLTLGCNPSASDINAALGTATATDACSNPAVSASDNAVSSNNCSRSQTRTFTAEDGCGNTSTASRTVSWTYDITPPTLTTGGTTLTLGCNPSASDINAALGTATATDACSNPVVSASDNAVSSNNCSRSQTRTFTAEDGCGNTTTESRTVSWTYDVTPPTLTTGGTTTTLGCNPSASDINAALGTATATDACSNPVVSASDNVVTSNNCSRSQTRTFTAEDGCGNTTTASRTVTWTYDVTPPTLTTGGTSLTLGCNPSASDINAALGTATATDACSNPAVSASDNAVSSNNCSRSQTRTFTAEDGCGNTTTGSRTVTWTYDVTPPTLTTGGTSLTLGCNPSASDINDALGTATATDACSNPVVSASDNAVSSNNCSRSQTRTFTAEDGCGNTTTAARTVSWTYDVTPPTLTTGGTTLTLGCNPSASDINAALGTATATDACSNPVVSASDNAVSSNNCSRSQTRTFTAEDGCGNTTTASRTVSWTYDVTPPTLTTGGTTLTLGCNPSASDINAALGTATATDACSNPAVSASDNAVSSNNCSRSQTRTFTAEDGCGNTTTGSRTVTWTYDVTPPTLTTGGTTLTLGCNPSASDINAALGTATATDACSNPIVSASDNAVSSNNCSRSQTRTFTAEDGCGNTTTASRTISWTYDVTPPTLTTGGTTTTLGCNPSASDINDALGTATATDACSNPAVSASDNAVTSNNCSRSQTRTFTAEDGCGNTTTGSRTVTWTYDVTPPTLTTGGTSLTLGCNPSASDINDALGTATATDACSNPIVSASDNAVSSNNCSRSQTRTFTAEDGCGNTTTASRTVSWTYDVTPPTLTTGGTTLTLGCNPSASDINAALGTATATDACSNPAVSASDNAVSSNDCLRSQTRTFTAEDGCGNTTTASRTVTWTYDVTPPTLTTGGTSLTLGCNPSASDINAALGTATATDACSNPAVSASDNAVSSNNCSRSQTRTFTAEDGCGNTSTASRTVSWTYDVTPPTLTTGGTTLTLGCNPSASDINAALGTATATDACGEPTVSSSDGSVGSNGCERSQTRTFTARDFCGNTSTASRTVTWIADLTPPVLTTGGTSTSLGCNPSAGDINGALGTATATDACGEPTVSSSDGSVGSNGCERTQTRTFTARDFCGNTSTASRTVTWIADLTPPVLTTGGTGTSLGCNPSAGDINGALGTATATDACGVPTVSSSDGSVSSNGCSRTQTRTFTARDFCGNTSTASRTVDWIADLTPPVLTTDGTGTSLGCNPSAGDINSALGTATATDACGEPTVSSSDGSIGSNGCERSQTRTWTARDFCGNTSTASRTVTWIADVTPPVLTTGGTSTSLGCNPSAGDINGALGTATATDACGEPTVSSSDGSIGSNGCERSQTRTFTARDFCGNTSTASRTVTWIADVTPPVLTTGGTSTSLGCNPSAGDINGALGTATATDACGEPTVSSSDGSIGSNGCERSQTRTFTARDFCGNTSTASRTVTWIADVTPPGLTTGGTSTSLGCNPSAGDINGALGTATATDACGEPTVSSSDGSIGSNGCERSQTRTFTARDFCGNTSTASRTVTWIADVTPPVLTTGGTSTSLGCNPSAGDINGALGTATATDACGEPTVSSSDGSIGSNGCERSQTRTFTARDFCGNTSTASRTVTWIADVTPPVLTTGGTSTSLGCNPSAGDINGALGTATATDACGEPTVSSSDGSIGSNGCERSQTRTFTARDFCGNTSTASRTVTWIADLTPPVLTTGGTSTSLGCNPSAGDINNALGTATATDACGEPTVSSSDGSTGSNGCSRTQTRTFTARDFCGNTSTASRTVDWIADLTPPVLTTGGTGTSLGCNPSAWDINGALGTATATDGCSTPTVSSTDGSVVSNGCDREQTRTFKATDFCGNTSTASRTVTWIFDITPPDINGVGGPQTISCPSVPESVFSSPTASDICSIPTLTFTDATVQGTCANAYTRTRTWKAIDFCGNTSTASQTITVIDNTPPVITGVGGPQTISCPATPVFSSPTASDACGAVTFTSTDADVPGTCANAYTRTRTWVAVDACSNTATASQTITVIDNTPPSLVFGVAKTSATLAAGDIAFVSFQSDNPDQFAFVALTNIAAGAVISFTDNGWETDNTFRITEGIVNWTAPAGGLAAGTIVVINPGTAPSVNIGTVANGFNGSPGLANGDDQVIAFTGTFNTGSGAITGVVLTGIQFNNAAWDANATDAMTSALPLGLTNGTNAIAVGITDNGKFTCSSAPTGNAASVGTIINTSANWTTSNSMLSPSVAPCVITVLATAPAPVTVQCASDVPAAPTVTAMDGCGGTVTPQLTESIINQTCPNKYQLVRKWTATDACGNTATTSHTVTVDDNTAPVVTAPTTVDMECSSDLPTAATTIAQFLALGGAAAIDNCTPQANLTISSTTGSLVGDNCNGTITRKYTISDACSNTTTVNHVFTVTDNTVPIVTAPTTVDLECSSDLPAGATTIAQYLALTGANANDNCTVQANLAVSSTTGPLVGNNCNGTITRTYTITDACNNSKTVNHVFTVTDNTVPVVTAPTTVDLECSSDLPAAATTIAQYLALTGANANDNCTAQANLTVSSTTGPLVGGNCNGTITRTYTITDACNNSKTVNHVFTVTDNTKPVVVAPNTVDLECDTDLPAAATTIAQFLVLTGANANDNCTEQGSLTVSSYTGALTGGTCNGIITRKYTITDGCGNATTVNHVFTVTDNTVPIVTAPTTVDLECSSDLPAGATTIAQYLALTGANANDNCTVQANLAVSSTTGPLVGNNCNGTITRTYTITDACNNSKTVNHVFTVTDNTVPVVTAPTTVDLECSSDLPAAATTIAQYLALTGANANDNCTVQTSLIVTSTTGPLVGGNCNGTITRTYTITDACNNSKTVNHVFTVTDNTKPVVVAPTTVDLECYTDLPAAATTIAQFLVLTGANANDNCTAQGSLTVSSYTGALTGGTCNGTITRRYTITDGCSNATTVNHVFTVTDNTKPTAICQNQTIQLNNYGNATVTPAQINNGSFDNCGSVTLSLDKTTFNCSNLGANTVKLTVTDACNNTSTCSATVTVEDNIAPTMTCPPNKVSGTDPGLCTKTFTALEIGTPTPSDNCGATATTTTWTRSDAAATLTAPFAFGGTTITWTVTDASGNTATCNQSISINKVNTVTTFTVSTTPSTNPVTQQYSDRVTFVATVTPYNCFIAGNIGGTVTFKIGSLTMGTAPVASDGTATLANVQLLEPSLSTAPALPDGSTLPNGPLAPYPLAGATKTATAEFSATDVDYNVTNPASKSIKITQEDARINYIGDEIKATPNATTYTQTILLKALITDISLPLTPPDPAYDAYAGDIRNARVMFVDRDNSNAPLSAWLTPTLVTADTRSGTVSKLLTLTIPSNTNSISKTIGIIVDYGYYYRNSSADNEVVTIYLPVGDFITGGGYIIPTNSVGTMASDPGRKCNFGFNVKFNKSGTNLQGQMNFIIRRTESDNIVHTYQFKSNAMQSLGVNITNPNRATANFVSKCNVADITNPNAPIALGGNKFMYVNMIDNGEPGINDSISFVVVTGNDDPAILANLLYSSNWITNQTLQMRLSGGNLVVHSGFNLNSGTRIDNTTITKAQQMETITEVAPFEVKVYPNPTEHQFTLVLENGSNEKVDIVVYDAVGRQVKKIEKGDASGAIRFGEDLKVGAYIVEVRQGVNRKTLKLVKQ